MRRRPISLLEENPSEEPLVNLTPLIDVVFVVLIAFMIVAPILSIDSVQLAQSERCTEQELPLIQNHPLTISIRANNTIWFQNRQISLPELKTLLRVEKTKHPLDTPQLIPDAKAHFETYQQVKNALEDCGFKQMDIILRPS